MALATAVILTLNRPDVLRRQLLHYANKPVHLIFADGSDMDWGGGESGSSGEMTWEYFRLEGYHSFSQRLSESCLRVKTDFMFFLDDEEPILWTGIKSAIEFLKQNSDYSCAGGRVDHMRRYSGYLGIMKYRHWGEKFEILDESPLERLKVLMSSGRNLNLVWQVMRTNEVKRFVMMPQTEFFFKPGRYIGLYELALSGFLVITGKWKMGDYPYWIRYGGSQKSQKQHKYFDLEDEKIVAELFETTLIDFEVPNPLNQIRMAQDLIDSGTFSIFFVEAAEAKVRHNLRDVELRTSKSKGSLLKLKKLPKNLLVKFFFLIWRVAPSLHKVLRPNGVRRLKTHAKIYGNGDKEIIDDLSLVEKIWGRFPNGLSHSQYEQELARV
jgi:glycosyltransferase domain-containing protein